MPRVPGHLLPDAYPCQSFPHSPSGWWDVRELALGNPVNGGQRFILHKSTPQILSPGHRKPTGQDPKIWGKRVLRTLSAHRSFSIPWGIPSHHPSHWLLPGPRIQASFPQPQHFGNLPLINCSPAWVPGRCTGRGCFVAFCLCFDARNAA